MSNFLFAFGMTGYNDVELLANISEKLVADFPFNLFQANRSLWALNKLDFYHKELFDKFEQVLKFKKDLIGEDIVVNYMSSLSRFEHINEDTKVILSRELIEKVSKYKYGSLASICTSMTKLDWNHKVALEIVKNELFRRFKDKDLETIAQEIKPLEITQFLVAYTHFQDFDSTILTLLEQIYVQ